MERENLDGDDPDAYRMGSIEPGMPADFVVLDYDAMTATL
jgi:cytosine/adenosine deaminase-related metal-dependent hydrolase